MKIRHRLLLSLILLIAASSLAIDLAAGILIDRAVSDRVRERLDADTALLARQLEEGWLSDTARADEWSDRTGAALGFRVTIIDPRGVVIGDSQVSLRDLAGVENHGGRPEITQAAIGGYGASGQTKDRIGDPLEYAARRVGPAEAPLGFIRLAASAADLRATSRSYRTWVTAISFAALSLMAAVACAAVGRFSRPIERLGRVADEVASGGYSVAMERDSVDEIGDLIRAIERMRRALIDQIGRAESERRLLASILSGLREGILVVDEGKELLLMNEAFRRTFGITRVVREGTPMIQIVWDRGVQEAYAESLTSKSYVSRRIAIPGNRSFELAVVPFTDSAGHDAGAIGLFFDVTRMEVLEKVRREFVADISHELRTPLSSLKASVETLTGGAMTEPGEAERFLGILMKNALRMEAILNDLTDLSLIETGAISLSPGPVDLGTAVREATASMVPRAASRQVTIEIDVPPGVTLFADRRRLDQILVNLLDNAVKFNRKGGSVKISGRRNGQKVILRVEDTGAGIPPDALDRVFHRFYRVDRARSQEVPGTGLGLAIVKHLVRLHRGEIRAENREGGGTRFILEFPLDDN